VLYLHGVFLWLFEKEELDCPNGDTFCWTEFPNGLEAGAGPPKVVEGAPNGDVFEPPKGEGDGAEKGAGAGVTPKGEALLPKVEPPSNGDVLGAADAPKGVAGAPNGEGKPPDGKPPKGED